ncbi:FtsX-like permease family protein [Nocardioides sp. Soil805]|uniref:FtsX-like permease family protein n=1 Tax=Nocardioides sp. Soil805 TaxID=1736416 RepID=UPI0007036A9C|nr:FtsX-like permease family protein [Nocardioides sp. Soil805]KRF34447.1 hypothetical protein ASG94_17360 [Nocardioides sp. Soil805]
MIAAPVDGLRVRRGTHAIIFAIAFITSTGTFTGIGVAREVGASVPVVLPMVMLVLVALLSCTAEVNRERRGDFALMRLRGWSSLRITAAVLAEPALSLTGGCVAGLVAGVGMLPFLARAWLPDGTSASVGVWPFAAVLVELALVAAAMAAQVVPVLRRPMTEQISATERPREAGVVSTFGFVLVFFGSVVGVYQAWADPGANWVVHATSCLLGLAAGMLAPWLVRGAGAWQGAGRRDAVAPHLAASRILRSSGVGQPLMVLVAAATVSCVALGGVLIVNQWAGDAGRIANGAPVFMRYQGTPQQALDATRAADPDGQWALAGATVFDDDRPESRRVYLDTSRYEDVVGGFLDTTAAREGSHAVDELRETSQGLPERPVMSNGRWTMRVAVNESFTRLAELTFRLNYVGDRGADVAFIEIAVPPGQSRTKSVRITGCDDRCLIRSLDVEEGRPCAQVTKDLCGRPKLTLDQVEAGGVDLTSQPWVLEGAAPGAAGAGPDATDAVAESGTLNLIPGRLEVRPARRGQSTLMPPTELLALPVLAAGEVDWGQTPEVKTPGGDHRPAELVGTYAALPVAGAGGVLADLATALSDSSPAVPAAQALILARDDIPADVMSALAAAGAEEPVMPDEQSSNISAAAGTAGVQVGWVVAVCSLMVGLLTSLVYIARLRRAHAQEEAVLRLLLVPTPTRAAANRREVWTLAFASAVVTCAAGYLAVVALLTRAELVDVPANQPALESPIGSTSLLTAIALVTLGCTLAVIAGGFLARHVRHDEASPASLREGTVTP